MKLAVGVNSYDEIGARMRMFMDLKSPQGFLDKLKMLPLLTEAGKFFPRTVPTGPCKEVIQRDNFSLLDFPVLQCWPKDAGRFITLPCVTTRDPKSGKRNLGMYRMQVYDERTTGMHWQRQKVAAEHARQRMRDAVEGKSAAVDIMARTSGGSILAEGDRPSGRMEVAVAIGTDPVVTFASIVPAPPEIEEYMIAGFLRGRTGRSGQMRNGGFGSARDSARSCSRATSTSTNFALRAHSVITPDFIHWKIYIRCCISPASRTEKIRSTPPRLSASRHRKTLTWARPLNGFSSR